jgi:hypothetical protein
VWWGKGGVEKEAEAVEAGIRGGEEEEEEKLGEGPTFVLPSRAPWRRGSVAAAVGRRSRGPRPNMGGKGAWSGSDAAYQSCSRELRTRRTAEKGDDERRTFVHLFSVALLPFPFPERLER